MEGLIAQKETSRSKLHKYQNLEDHSYIPILIRATYD